MRPCLLTALLAVPLLCALPAFADPVLCSTRVNGTDVPMAYDTSEPGLRSHYSLREIAFTTWARDTCPSYVVLRTLTPHLTDAERGPFCLRHDPQTDSTIGYDVGDRDAYGRCKRPARSVCQRVNQTRDAAAAITATAARRTLTGVLMARNSAAGAVIMSGSKAVVADALGSIGGAAATVATSPAALAGAAVTIVAVGGAVYACSGAEPG